MIIDAHAHLWKEQKGLVNGLAVYHTRNGKSMFNKEELQMLPPYMNDGENTVERFLANMDYARVNACVITQEYIDGNQDAYLLEAKEKYPNRMKICSLYEEDDNYRVHGFDGIKICASRLSIPLSETLPVFKKAEKQGMFISIDLSEGAKQVKELEYIVKECPNVKIAIGHFGMPTFDGFEKQIGLATYPNVYIESGGITWLFHKEFYPYPSAIKAIRTAIDICGIEKLMWGSDYPRTMTAITYKMSYDFIVNSNELTDYEKERFLFKNAYDFYGFSNMVEMPYIKNMVE